MSMAPHKLFRYFKDPATFGSSLIESPTWKKAIASAEEAYAEAVESDREFGPVPGGDPVQTACVVFVESLGLQLDYGDIPDGAMPGRADIVRDE